MSRKSQNFWRECIEAEAHGKHSKKAIKKGKIPGQSNVSFELSPPNSPLVSKNAPKNDKNLENKISSLKNIKNLNN